MLSFSPKREGRREGEGYILDPTLSTYCLFLRVVLLEDDWSSSTNLSIAFVQLVRVVSSVLYEPQFQTSIPSYSLSIHIARSTSLIGTNNKQCKGCGDQKLGGAKFFTLAHTFHG